MNTLVAVAVVVKEVVVVAVVAVVEVAEVGKVVVTFDCGRWCPADE